MENPDPIPTRRRRRPGRAPHSEAYARASAGIWAAAGRLTTLSGIVLALSAFTDWYAGVTLDGSGAQLTGWNAGAPGKLVFFVGLAVVGLAALRTLGIEPPRSVPESLVIVALGSLGAILVLVRIVSVPTTALVRSGLGIGIWISLAAALGVIVAGLLRAGEEL